MPAPAGFTAGDAPGSGDALNSTTGTNELRPATRRATRSGPGGDDPVDFSLEAATTDPERPRVVVGECALENRAQRPRKPSLGDDDLVVDDLDSVGSVGERVPNRAVHREATTQAKVRLDDDDARPIEFDEGDVPYQLVRQPRANPEMRSGADGDLVVGLGGLEAWLPPGRVILRVTQEVE